MWKTCGKVAAELIDRPVDGTIIRARHASTYVKPALRVADCRY
jgi:hypothetical protein